MQSVRRLHQHRGWGCRHISCTRRKAISPGTLRATTEAAFFPSFVDAEHAREIKDQGALRMLRQMKQVEVSLPGSPLGRNGTLLTAVVGPSQQQLSAYPADAPVAILLHGFDSSCLEMRRVYPLLEAGMPTYAVDLVGWGFTDHSWLHGHKGSVRIGPEAKRAHLLAFLEQHVPRDRRVLLLGASVGGAVAMDFAVHHPERVDKLVLVDPQVFIDGIGPLAKLPRFAAELGVKVLKQYWLRSQANVSSYYDKKTYATDDAVKVGRLQTFSPGWLEANVAFMSSGGYAMSKRIKDVKADTLVLWGRQDEILNPEWANRISTELPSSKLVMVEESGHFPHLEHADVVAQKVLEFAGVQGQVQQKQPGVVAAEPLAMLA